MEKNWFKTFAETVFSEYGIRFTRKEKDRFLDFYQNEFLKLGFCEHDITVHKNWYGGKNLIVGPLDAEVFVTAHYDTPGNNAFLALPFSAVFGGLIATLLGLLLMLLILSPTLILDLLQVNVTYRSHLELVWCFFIMFLLFLNKNKNNVNDNTSGTLGVYHCAAAIINNPELKSKCAFILFDNEEKMLLGSMAFSRWHRKHHPNTREPAVINLDCIALGSVLVLAADKKSVAWPMLPKLAEYFQSHGFDTMIKASNFTEYMSDHFCFPKGLMLIMLERSRLGPLYIPNIHSGKDKEYDLEQLERVCSCTVSYLATTNAL